MKDLLTKLVEHRPLTRDDAAGAMQEMLSGNASPEQIAGFLLGIRARGETLDELVGMTQTMREFAVPVLAPAHAIDIVGTGGDRAPAPEPSLQNMAIVLFRPRVVLSMF